MKCTKNRYNQKHFQLFTKKKRTLNIPKRQQNCHANPVQLISDRYGYYLLCNAILVSITDKVVIKNVFT